MLLESSNQATSTHQSGNQSPVRVRLRFRKDGLLRLVSHHDLMQCFEMMFRRAEIPFASTQGYHPKPKMAFALSLALGVVGRQEVVELEMLQAIEPCELQRRLNRQCPAGIEILCAEIVDRKNKARPVLVGYQIEIPAEWETATALRIDDLLGQSEYWIQRKKQPGKTIDIRPLIKNISLQDNLLQMDLYVTPGGMVRPDEILDVLGNANLLDAGAVLVRNKMVLLDETNESNFTNLRSAKTGKPSQNSESRNRQSASLLPGPMSFDT